MPDKSAFMYESTAEIIRTALEVAFNAGEISDDDYTDATWTLNGVPRNAACEGRGFHTSPAHVCDPEPDDDKRAMRNESLPIEQRREAFRRHNRRQST